MTNNNNGSKYFVILDIVGLDVSHLDSSSQKYPNISSLFEKEGEYGYMKPVFPSVTSTGTSKHIDRKISKGAWDYFKWFF